MKNPGAGPLPWMAQVDARAAEERTRIRERLRKLEAVDAPRPAVRSLHTALRSAKQARHEACARLAANGAAPACQSNGIGELWDEDSPAVADYRTVSRCCNDQRPLHRRHATPDDSGSRGSDGCAGTQLANADLSNSEYNPENARQAYAGNVPVSECDPIRSARSPSSARASARSVRPTRRLSSSLAGGRQVSLHPIPPHFHPILTPFSPHVPQLPHSSVPTYHRILFLT